MGLLQPESGLLFWMTLAFGTVFFLVAKFGFPVIVKAIDDRKHYIDSSLVAARKARQQLSEVETEKRMMLMEAEAERAGILRAAAGEQERLLSEAREQAAKERARLVADARAEAEAEREAILRDARQQVALLAVAVTEKMLRRELQDRTAQAALAGQLLDEIEHSKYGTTCTPD
ncbi:F0F1 ATP synthase subunit B [Bacteroides sp. f07]|uniref:F0F1 ATP synthase subunit B n=1 Tax=Bacteroides sp. f07 TaxID=3132704 RepID=UPI0034AD2583